MAARTDGGEKTPSSQGGTIRNPGDEAAPGAPQTGEVACPECHGSGRVQGGAARGGAQTLSSTMAMPWPTPMHMVARA